MSKSKLGAGIGILLLAAIAASFAMADVQSTLSGSRSLGTSELARVGSETITDRDIDRAMQQRLSQVRQQNPEADYSTIAGDFDQIISGLIDERALSAFAEKTGFNLSKLLVDAEVATIPGARGLNGEFSEQAYANWRAQQRLSDSDVRGAIRTGLLQQLMIAPVAAIARAPVGMARPYASMLLEQREGQVALLPIDAFRAGLKASDKDIQGFYAANQRRYTVPQQRVLRIAKIGPEQVGNVAASDQEIAEYYKANPDKYAVKEVRVISQAVVPDQKAAQAIADRIRGGASFVQAAAPAGLSAEDVSVGPQTRSEFTSLAGEKVAAAAFAAQKGATVGPVQSDLGWHVVKIDDVQREGGKTLAEARSEIAATLTASKRKEALTDLVTKIEDEIADGASLTEAAKTANLKIVDTPLITASGKSRADPAYTLPEEFKPALKSGFDLGENEEPVVETMPNDAGYLLVGVGRLIAAAPAPLAEIRDQVAKDWVTAQATARARNAANAIAKRAAGSALSDAVKASGNAPAQLETINVRRIQLSRFQGNVPPPLALLFSMGQGKARMVEGNQGEGFYVVKVNKIVPGNALTNPSLISQTQQQMQDTLSREYAEQFIQAMRNMVGVKRNEAAIAEAKRRILGGS